MSDTTDARGKQPSPFPEIEEGASSFGEMLLYSAGIDYFFFCVL